MISSLSHEIQLFIHVLESLRSSALPLLNKNLKPASQQAQELQKNREFAGLSRLVFFSHPAILVVNLMMRIPKKKKNFSYLHLIFTIYSRIPIHRRL